MPLAERAHAAAAPLRFGPGGRFELRPAEYRLMVDGEPAALGGRALDLLIALAARPAQLLTKSELLDLVWPGLVVEENNLRVQINALRRVLGEDAIATVPGRGYRLSVAVVDTSADAATASALAPAKAPGDADPPAMPMPLVPRLFGRSADLDRVDALLGDGAGGRCITLVGMPGVGKSSLARSARARWRGRSAWVDLAPLTDGAQMAGAIARALGAQLDGSDPGPQILRALPRDTPVLLVLDNAEHLVDAAADWAARLAGAPGLRLLVISQLPLSVSGEQVHRLQPLAVGDASDPSDGALALLVERIAAADHRFRITPAILPVLAALCLQLDGLPLALEMAAARVPVMGLQAVHDALVQRFALLTAGRRDAPARHRTLHDALDWSYRLLGAPEQRLFRALGVFAGGFTLDLAVGLTADEHVGRWDVVDGLAALVDRSLVAVSAEDPPRYRLLETMRAYALEQIAASAAQPADADEGRSLRRRHAGAVLALFVRHDSDAQCLAEMENMREAFGWARVDDLALAAQLSTRAAQIIGFTVWRQEVTDWLLALEPAMRGAAGRALPLSAQAAWWSMLAYVLNVRRSRAAAPAAAEAVALWRRLDDPGELQAALGHWVRAIGTPGPELDAACDALQRSAADGTATPRARLRVQGALAEAARVRGDVAALLACREQELAMARELGWGDMAQAAETNVCAALIELGRHAEAAARARTLLARVDGDGDGDDNGNGNGNLPWALNVLVEALVADGSHDEARALVPRSLAAGRRFGTTVAWQGILTLTVGARRLRAAGRLVGHVEQLWSAHGGSPDRDEIGRLEHARSAVRAAFGAETATALETEGRGLDEATAAALAAAEHDAP